MTTCRSEAARQFDDVLAEADPSVQTCVKVAQQLKEHYRQHADDLEARLAAFLNLERDMAELIAHSEQLSNELERARAGTPAQRNAQEASRRAITRMFKIMNVQEGALQQLSASVKAFFEKEEPRVAEVQASIAKAKAYVASYKAEAKNYEDDDAAPERGRRRAETALAEPDGVEKTRDKERKKDKKSRSKSPDKERKKRERTELRHL